jgi:uncharacterized protein YjbI with pentapeptide repeats
MIWPAVPRRLRLSRKRRRVLVHLFAVLLALLGNTPAALTARAAPAVPAPAAAPAAAPGAAPAAAPAAQIGPTELCTLHADGTTTCARFAPPDLLTLGDGTGGLSDGGLYAATPEQAEALKALQKQAVADVILRHGLNAGDADAVLSWGRDEALAQLYLLLVAAIQATSPTEDQKQAVAWVRAVAQRRAVAAAYSAGFEYVKWAGLDQAEYTRLMNRNASKSELQTFLSGQVLNYNAPQVDATGGFCKYRSPAPFADEYKGYNTPVCNGPVLQIIPNPPAPTFDQFVKYGQAVASYSLLDSAAYRDTALRFGVALGFAVGVAALAYAPVILTASGSLATVQAIFPYFGTVSYATGTAVGSMATVLAGYVAGAAVVIAALTVAIIQALVIIDEAKLPGKLASLIDDARTTPPAASDLVSSTSITSLTSLFIGATLPPPSNRSCDNSDPLARAGVTILKGGGQWVVDGEPVGPVLQVAGGDPCLNLTPIQKATAFDPQLVVTAQGATAATVSPTITWKDPGTGAPATARLSQAWFVRQAGGADASQSLRLDYTDWAGTQQRAWLLAPTDGSYTFLGYASSESSIDSTTCIAQKKCFVSPSIQYVGGDGAKYSASVRPYTPPGGTPKYTPLVEGSPATFEANGFAPAAARTPVTYKWRFQQVGCGIAPCQAPNVVGGLLQGFGPEYSEPVAGATVEHTFQASGQAQVELTATDSAGATATTTFTVSIANVAPTLQVAPDCPASPCTPRSGEAGAVLSLEGSALDPASRDDLTVTVNWGDGTGQVSDSLCRSLSCAVDGLQTTRAPKGEQAGRGVTLKALHAYAAPGTYHGMLWVSDEAASVSQAFTMTIGLAQAITFPALVAQTYGGPPVALAATGGASGQPVTFAVTGDPTVCAVADGAVALLRTGTCAITASQAGDTVYMAAPSVTEAFRVLPASLTVTGNDKTVPYGAALPAFDARFEGLLNNDGAGAVRGLTCRATYYEDLPVIVGQPIGQYPISCSGGIAENYLLTYQSGGTLTITMAESVVTLTAATAAGGQPVTLTAGVAVKDGTGLVGGTVEFKDGGVVIDGCAAQRVDFSRTRAATCTTSSLGAGDHTFSATYSGNENLSGSSTATAVTLTVTSAPFGSTVRLVPSGPSMRNRPATFTAVVAPGTQSEGPPAGGGRPPAATATPAGGGRTPTGTVTFTADGQSLGTAQLALVGGQIQATLTTSSLTLGRHELTARYTGDGYFQSSTAAGRIYYVNTNLSNFPRLPNGAYNLSKGSLNFSGGYFLDSALQGANLAGADLSRAVFDLADLTGATLSNGANLDGASFTSATLRSANLSQSTFKGANFKGADLRGANLSDANFQGATDLRSADLRDVVWGNTTCPDGTNSNQNGGTCLGHF